jgi:hypothetical protein
MPGPTREFTENGEIENLEAYISDRMGSPANIQAARDKLAKLKKQRSAWILSYAEVRGNSQAKNRRSRRKSRKNRKTRRRR